MPRLSLYHPNRTNDYRFFDKTISEMYTVGGVDIYIHKYLGPIPGGTDSAESGNFDATQPNYSYENPLFIQDLLLLENRDRAYDPDIYRLRGVYRAQDIDFDLSQFGLFLNNDTLFITFHYNDMMDTIGRKLMSGDVLEVPNLRDMNPLDPAIPRALPRYYVIQDAAFASEGFSQTWMPHLWRVKATPMVNAQEYQEIVNKPFVSEQIWDNGNFYPSGSIVNSGDVYYQAIKDVPVGTPIDDTEFWQVIDPPAEEQYGSTRPKDNQLNDAILLQAELEVPLSGYDTVKFYIFPTNPDGTPAPPAGVTADGSANGSPVPTTVEVVLNYTTGSITREGTNTPINATIGIDFPIDPEEGQLAVRTDYFPARLYQYINGTWSTQPLSPNDTIQYNVSESSTVTVTQTITVDSTGINSSVTGVTPRSDGYTIGYLTGDGIAPNGLPVTPGVSFPSNPANGQYCLRLDYFPNRLFRFNGTTWIKIEDKVRTDLTNGPMNQTLRSRFVNNTYTVSTTDLGNIPSRQSLSEILEPKADNGDQGGFLPPNPRPPGR